MKKYNYLTLLGFCLLLAQSGDISALTMSTRSHWDKYWKKNGAGPLVVRFSKDWQITDPADTELLYAATEQNSTLLLKFKEEPRFWAKRYPSNVLRAAKDVAEITQGENSRGYRTLERMLSYK